MCTDFCFQIFEQKNICIYGTWYIHSKKSVISYYERVKHEKFLLNVYDRNIWWIRPESARPSGFYEFYISATMRVIILKHRQKDAHIEAYEILNESTEPRELQIYPNSKNFQHFLNKLTFVSLISSSYSQVLNMCFQLVSTTSLRTRISS